MAGANAAILVHHPLAGAEIGRTVVMKQKLGAIGEWVLIGALMGCGGGGGKPDAGANGLDSSPVVDAESAADGAGATNFCTGPATGTLIDDMSGPVLGLTAPSCGSPGAWTAGPLGTITIPSGDPSVIYNCGSLCRSLYSPMPADFPGTVAPGGLDGSSGPQAMCVAGQTPSAQYSGSGLTLEFAFSGVVPVGGPSWITGEATGFTSAPPPSLLDASQYSGIEFWLWVSPSTVAEVTAGFQIQLIDKNQLLGGGVCNSTGTPLSSACTSASAAVLSSPFAAATSAGPLFGGDGSELTALVGGWQIVRAPWSSFVAFAGRNEQFVDPTSLAFAQFTVTQMSVNGMPVAFDFCIYALNFYR